MPTHHYQFSLFFILSNSYTVQKIQLSLHSRAIENTSNFLKEVQFRNRKITIHHPLAGGRHQ